jgi:hypothetical protein
VKRRGPRAVGDLLESAVPELGDRLLVLQLRGAWSSIVGAAGARRSRPESITNGCLHVLVDNSPWLQELTLRSRDVTARVAARCGTIRTLRFTLGRPEVSSATQAPATTLPARPLDADDVREIDATVASIRDPEVRAAARRLLGTARRRGPRRGAV